MDTRWVMSEGPQGAIAPPGARVKRRTVETTAPVAHLPVYERIDFEKA